MPKLSKPLIAALNPTDQDVVVWDSSLPGFGLRAKASGVKTFVIQYRNRSGRSRRLSVGSLGKVTLDQARKEAVKLLGQVAAGADPAEERRMRLRSETILQLADVYMKEHCAGRCKPRTIEAHTWLLNKLIKPRLGRRKLLELRPVDIAKMHADLQSTPYNANRALGLLRAMLNCAERWEMIPRGSNPAAVIKPYPERKRERFLSADELKSLMDALNAAEAEESINRYEAAAIRLLIFTGCRLSEITTQPPGSSWSVTRPISTAPRSFRSTLRPMGRRSNLLHGGRGHPKSVLRDGTPARCMNLKDTRNYAQRTYERERGGFAKLALL